MQHSQQRWHTLSLPEQLGNIGSEYSRMLSSLKRNDQDRFKLALVRFLELLDFSINDPRWNVARKKELLRLRETSCENYPANLQKYFDQFALLSRRQQNIIKS